MLFFRKYYAQYLENFILRNPPRTKHASSKYHNWLSRFSYLNIQTFKTWQYKTGWREEEKRVENDAKGRLHLNTEII